jgi:hypothetical protein
LKQPLTNELKKSNNPRAKQCDKEQADPKRCWPCAEPLWSYHAHKPCKEREQTAYEQYNETERFDTKTVKVHTALCALVQRFWRKQACVLKNPAGNAVFL